MRRLSHPANPLLLPVGNNNPNAGLAARLSVRARTVGRVVEPDSERLAAMRVEYGSVEKDGSRDLDADWLADGWLMLLRTWIGDAERAGVAEPNAMVLATVRDGRPVSRSVLCKSVEETGITFYTNYDSAKGDELAATPYASATFPWFQLGRQVHVRGAVTKVSAEETADYWSKRPRGSQLGAWASRQSQPIASRATLLGQLAEVTERFAAIEHVPVPPNWGGYRISPDTVEFWQGRENRVHNRIRVIGGRVERLQP
jgi:pyridoxamine 5'-phosphate oxidase